MSFGSGTFSNGLPARVASGIGKDSIVGTTKVNTVIISTIIGKWKTPFVN